MERRADLYCIDWDWTDSHTVGKMDPSPTVHQQQNFFFLSLSLGCTAIYRPHLMPIFLPPLSFLLSHFCLFSFFLRSKSQLCTLAHTNTFTHTHASAFSSIEWLYCHYCLAGTISPKQFMKWQLSNTNKMLNSSFFTGWLFGLKTWAIQWYTINDCHNYQSCN